MLSWVPRAHKDGSRRQGGEILVEPHLYGPPEARDGDLGSRAGLTAASSKTQLKVSIANTGPVKVANPSKVLQPLQEAEQRIRNLVRRNAGRNQHEQEDPDLLLSSGRRKIKPISQSRVIPGFRRRSTLLGDHPIGNLSTQEICRDS